MARFLIMGQILGGQGHVIIVLSGQDLFLQSVAAVVRSAHTPFGMRILFIAAANSVADELESQICFACSDFRQDV